MNNKKKNLKIYLIATEASGDVIGSNLIKTLKKIKKELNFTELVAQK